MSNISESYAKDLDLNLLRVFAVVAEEKSITRAASRLYVTQPAVSGSMRRLASFIGAELFARQGRGLVLTHRGADLLAATRTHLPPLVAATVTGPAFDAKASSATVRLGLFDALDVLVLPALLARLRTEAPRIQLVVSQVQFRNVEELLVGNRIDLALGIADELPRSILRRKLVAGPRLDTSFAVLYDPRHAKLRGALTERTYFAMEHVVVSYAGDTRGIVEDCTKKVRKVRVSLPGFSLVADVVDGSPLLATVPTLYAAHVLRIRPHLRSVPLPFRFAIGSHSLELLWTRVGDEDEVLRFVRELVAEVYRARTTTAPDGVSRARSRRRPNVADFIA